MVPHADDVVSVGRYTIPASELSWSFGTSGGPGGQHANRSNTRAELRFDLGSSEIFPPSVKELMIRQLGNRIVDGEIIVVVDESRSQWRNRSIARRRLSELLETSMRRPTPRKRTRPTKASQRRRVEHKRQRSEVKRLRQRPDVE